MPCPCTLGNRPVQAQGDPASPIWLIAEAPGEVEDRVGVPLVGKSGKESDNYLTRAKLSRDLCFVDNVVSCRPPGNRDPKPAEIEACRDHLEAALALMSPTTIIATLGRIATRWFLPGADTETIHGIPQRWHNPITDTHHTLVPCYHPAAGLHSTRLMTQLLADYQTLGEVYHGTYISTLDPYPNPTYSSLQGAVKLSDAIMAVDTESAGSTPWSVQVSMAPGTGYIVKASDKEGLIKLRQMADNPDHLWVFHFAQHDLPVLAQMGIVPARWTCTLLMTNLLQDLPRGLKALAYRLCGMAMTDYTDVMGPYTVKKCLAYFEGILAREWPNPEPVLERVKRDWKIRQPQNITKLVKGIIRDYEKNQETDVWDRWVKVRDAQVEEVLGPLTPATIAEIPWPEAKQYSIKDADATRRVYFILWDRICSEGLRDVLERDCREVPMVVDIQQGGMPVDVAHFQRLEAEFSGEMDGLEVKIEKQVGYWINPGSANDCRELLFSRLGLKPLKQTKTKANFSADDSVLERLKDKHPVIQDIITWREIETLQSTFVKSIIDKAGQDGIIRSSWSMATVVTGRLSSRSPNLMNIPVRTERGRKLREGFVAPPGTVILEPDFSNVELRVAAVESQDPLMLEIFRTGKDMHTITACHIFGLPEDQIDEMKHRYPTKRANFGILYGISAAALFRELEVSGAEGWSEAKCEDLINHWFQTYPGMQVRLEEWKQEARRFHKVHDMFGRYRLVPEVMSVHYFVREAGLRQAINAPIQMGAQGIIKQAMGELVPVYRYFQDQGYICRPMAQVHDSLPFLMEEGVVEVAVPVIQSVMESAVTLSVPLKVDWKIGKNWGQMEKLKL